MLFLSVLNKARNKAHILIGLVVANDNIDKILELIKKSKDPKQAKENLIKLIDPNYVNQTSIQLILFLILIL